MSTTLIASVVGFISAALMSIISHFLIIQKERKIRLQALKSKIHDEQLNAYKKLWACLEPTSKYSSKETIINENTDGVFLNIEILNIFIKTIRQLFFSEYGIFLSRNVRKELFALLDLLREISKKCSCNNSTSVKISKSEKGKIRHQITKLIESIRGDIGLMDVDFPAHLLNCIKK